MGKRSSTRGADYEREIAKKICSFFGENTKEWEKHFRRTKRTKGGQPEGDIVAKGPILHEWMLAGLGPIEAKNRTEWSLMEMLKAPAKSKLYGYWLKSNEDTDSANSIVCFTKAYSPDLVFFDATQLNELVILGSYFSTYLSTVIDNKTFLIVRLEQFLTYYFPQYGPRD